LVAGALRENHERCAAALATACAARLRVAAGDEQRVSALASGFGQGRAGVALALHVLATSGLGDDLLALRDAALSGATEPNSRVDWCHGAAGIGIGCLAMDGAEGSIEQMTTAVELHGWLPGDSLCHGALGNTDLLLLTGHDARPWGAGVLARRRIAGAFACGGPRGVIVPGLMIGLAGIGYQLLRISAPAELPPLLVPGAGCAPRADHQG
jgi:lantibiotic modifying enzyme